MRLFRHRPRATTARVGVIGDVHACDEALAAVLDSLQGGGVDAIWCVGDIVNGPGDPDRCAAMLESAGVVTVRGNHDRWLLEGREVIAGAHRPEDLAPGTRAYLSSLPASVTVGLAGGQTALLCHGLGDNDMNGITADDYGYALEANDELQALLSPGGPGLVVKGHRHRHAVWRIGRMTLVDAGSLLEPSAPCAAVVDAAARTITPLRLSGPGVVADPPRAF
jgi:predicted phosphodiesterase